MTTEADLDAALFAPEPALFGADRRASTLTIRGHRRFRAVVPHFSTWVGRHGIYLEDLYVRPEFRGHGYGRELFNELVAIADERGYGRVEWAVLDWNEPAHRFYESLGGRQIRSGRPGVSTGDARG